jgi:hypothetical protein
MYTNNFTFLVCHLAAIIVTACSSHLACGSVRQMGRSRTDEGTYWDIMDPILGPVARALPEPKSAAQLFPPMARHLCHNSTMRGKHLRTSFASVIHASRAVTRVIHTSRARHNLHTLEYYSSLFSYEFIPVWLSILYCTTRVTARLAWMTRVITARCNCTTRVYDAGERRTQMFASHCRIMTQMPRHTHHTSLHQLVA